MSNGKRFGFVSLGFVAVGAALLACLATFSLQKGVGVANSPVKVHGGAMAFRSDTPWQVEARDGSGNPIEYCLAYNPAKISFVRVSPATGPILTSKGAWTLVFNGADPGKNVLSPSNNGIKMEENNTACLNSSDSGYAIHLTPLIGTASAFYPNIKQEKDGSSAVRFEDTTPAVGSAPSICSGPNGNPAGDEDACERLSQITVTVGSTSYGAPACQEHGCEVDFYP